MRRRVLRMVYGNQWSPCRIGVRVGIAVRVGVGNCRPGAPESVEVLRLEARDIRVCPRGVHHGKIAGGAANVQFPIDGEAHDGRVRIHSLPEIRDVSLLGGPKGAVPPAVVARLGEVLYPRGGGHRIRAVRSKLTTIREREWPDLADIRAGRLGCAAAVRLELAGRRWSRAALVQHNVSQ